MSEPKRNGISQIAVHCSDCYHGRYELVTRDEEYPMMDGSRMVLPRVNYLLIVRIQNAPVRKLTVHKPD